MGNVPKLDHWVIWSSFGTFCWKENSLRCQASSLVQEQYFAENGQIQHHDDFDLARVQDAIVWLDQFIAEGRGTGALAHPGYSEKEVRAAFESMHESACSVDGLSKKSVRPAIISLLPEITALFSYLRVNGLSLDEWAISVITAVKKKEPSLTDMSNFRGVHVLCFFRQLFVQCFLPELVSICNSPRGTSTWVPIWQQGFVPGRRIYASFLSL